MRANEISAFDVIGPIMIGPSSSHTAGALRIALIASRLLTAELQAVSFTLYGSFRHTYRGHGTDRALLAGAMGLGPDDPRIRDSHQLAAERGLQVSFLQGEDEQDMHPNTVDIRLQTVGGEVLDVRGVSTGGGRAVITRINGVDLEVTGRYNTLVLRHVDRPGVIAAIASRLSDAHINIAFMKLYREERGRIAWTIVETDEAILPAIPEELEQLKWVEQALLVPAVSVEAMPLRAPLPSISCRELYEACQNAGMDMGRAFPFLSNASGEELSRAMGRRFGVEELSPQNAKDLAACSQATGLGLFPLMLGRECLLFGGDPQDHLIRMRRVWQVMKQSIDLGLAEHQPTMGGLIGGEAAKLLAFEQLQKGQTDILGRLAAYAMAVLESNASMGLIVAAPTAGASGVLPASFLVAQEEQQYSDEAIIEALFVASAIGLIIMANGSVSGAEGGCQAETGSASAMAASALVSLGGASLEAVYAAASTALQHVLGTVCDPIHGLVEAPCQRRNAIAALNALLSARLALAGLSGIVDLDAMILTARDVGASLPSALRETGQGGTAAAYQGQRQTACASCAACAACL